MVYIIAAYAAQRVIGSCGRIPWKITGEQKRFKELTLGNVVIMGRRSFEEIGKPLPGRDTIVISNKYRYEAEHLMTAGSLEEALALAEGREIFVSGGGGLYKEALPIAEKMYITLIDQEIEGDTFFPDFLKEDWLYQEDQIFEGDIPYKYVTYTRKKD